MKLTDTNYYSQEANESYLSASGVKAFRDCEAAYMATIQGLCEPKEQTTAMLVGSYVDCRLLEPAKYPAFREEHRDAIHKRGGFKRADFERADQMVDAVKRQEYVMKLLEGESQAILTGDIQGVPFKSKLDVLNRDTMTLVDLKTTADVNSKTWSAKHSRKVGFIDAWDYWTQMYIYLDLCGRNDIEIKSCYIVAVDKKSPPAVRVYDMSDTVSLKDAQRRLQTTIQRFANVKDGATPSRCGDCEYCRETELIDAPMTYTANGWNW